MAKSGTLAVSSGHASQTAENASVLAEVAPPRPTSATLGAVVKNALKGLSVAGLAVVDVANRKVGVSTRNADFYAYLLGKVTALTGDLFEFTPADPTRSSAGWTVRKANVIIGQTLTGSVPTGLGGILVAGLGFSQPSRSLESLVNSIEDALTEAGLDGVILIDQVAEKVWMSHCADISSEWADPAVNMFGNFTWMQASYPVTVQANLTDATGVPDGSYDIVGGSLTGNNISVAGGVASGDLGTEADEITLEDNRAVDSTARKVAVVTQTVSAIESSGTGMFAS